jgi:hypothetical protein
MSHNPIRLLLDEHIWEGLAAALQEQGFDVVHVNHVGLRNTDDDVIMAHAAAEGRTILTYNHRDFVPLVALWFEEQREHSGVILSVQLPRGELLRQTLNLLDQLSCESCQNTVRWLQMYK